MRVNPGSGKHLNGRSRLHTQKSRFDLSQGLQTSQAAKFTARIRLISSVEINLNTRFAPSLVNLTLCCRRRRSYQEARKINKTKTHYCSTLYCVAPSDSPYLLQLPALSRAGFGFVFVFRNLI